MLKRFRARRKFRKAAAQVSDNEVLCGTYTPEGEPVYFTAPANAPDDMMRRLAFEARWGRPMSKYEEMLLEHAKARKSQ